MLKSKDKGSHTIGQDDKSVIIDNRNARVKGNGNQINQNVHEVHNGLDENKIKDMLDDKLNRVNDVLQEIKDDQSKSKDSIDELRAIINDGDLGAAQQANKEFNDAVEITRDNDKLEKKESEVINWLVLIGFVLSIIGMILFVVLTDKLPIKKFLMAGGILSGVVFMLVIGITGNKDPKVQNGESDENFNRKD